MITLSTMSEFKAFHGNMHAPDRTPLGNYWLQHPNRRQYDGIVFDPEEAIDERYYNMWRGFAVEPKEGDCSRSLIRLFVSSRLCDNLDETGRNIFPPSSANQRAP